MTSFDMRPGADPILDAAPLTALDQLADALGRLTAGEKPLPVNRRPGFRVVYSLDLDGARMAAMRKACVDDTQPTGVNEFQVYAAILATYCQRIEKDGKPLADDAGRPLTFRSARLWELLGIPLGSPSGASLAAKEFLGGDGQVQATCLSLLQAAGWGDEVARNPTEMPSIDS